jgi:tRNA(Ile)-lysidine synthetase-like protein
MPRRRRRPPRRRADMSGPPPIDDPNRLEQSVATVPPGSWAVGVSGGADSVALLDLLVRYRGSDLSLHVIHLDHQTRGQASTGDATFVNQLASKLNLPCTIARRDQIQPLLTNPPTNPSALYRQLRLTLFRKVVEQRRLCGVLLAHHADDQAETVLHRLLRGSAYAGLAGMSPRTCVNQLVILRPLLGVGRAPLREHLARHGLSWREDASNASPKYLRNRLRRLLAAAPVLCKDLLSLSQACAELRDWVRLEAPQLQEQFPPAMLANLPRILADQSARTWLASRGVPADQILPSLVERLRTMAQDAASPARFDLPGGLRLRRRGGVLFVERAR